MENDLKYIESYAKYKSPHGMKLLTSRTSAAADFEIHSDNYARIVIVHAFPDLYKSLRTKKGLKMFIQLSSHEDMRKHAEKKLFLM